MTPNKRTVDMYMDGFRRTARADILSCLTEDVVWEIPGVFTVQGKPAFNSHIVDEGFAGHPVITVTRLVETTT
jgi:ketosteroid isomerase-like protein